MRDEVFPAMGAGGFTLDTRSYAPGLYFYVFSWQDVKDSGKFIIIR
jgi:hypothetical protein